MAVDRGSAGGATGTSVPEKVAAKLAREQAWEPLSVQDVARAHRDHDRRLRGEPLVEPHDSRKARTRMDHGWCDRDAAHRRYVLHMRDEARRHEDADAVLAITQ